MRKYPPDVKYLKPVLMRIWKWSKDGTQTTFPVSRRRNDARGQYPKLPLSPPLPSKIFYWTFQGSTSFVDLLWVFFLAFVCCALVSVCLYVPCGHLLGKGWPLGSRLWCPTVSLSLSHWYPGSGVVLDCIDFWSLHPYLLLCCINLCCKIGTWANFWKREPKLGF